MDYSPWGHKESDMTERLTSLQGKAGQMFLSFDLLNSKLIQPEMIEC